MRTLYNSIYDNELKLSDLDRSMLLTLDHGYKEVYEEFWYKWDRTDCKNLKEEFDKFMSARKDHKKY